MRFRYVNIHIPEQNKVYANKYNSLSIIDDKLWEWGCNNYGQLGNNSNISKFTPIIVYGCRNFINIYKGTNIFDSSTTDLITIIGKDNSNRIFSWGNNTFGQLGNNSIINKSTPVSICGNHIFNEIYSTQVFNIGIDDNGTWGWGINDTGQLGDNTVENRSTPVAVCGNHTFCEIYLGLPSFGIDNYGRLWSWGLGTYGGLGNNTVINVSTPIVVCGNHTFCKINNMIFGCIGLDNYGKLWSWGYNSFGQLGDNTIMNTPHPKGWGIYLDYCKVVNASKIRCFL